MHLLLSPPEDASHLAAEAKRACPTATIEARDDGLLLAKALGPAMDRLPHLVFARQTLPAAVLVGGASIRGWAESLFEALSAALPEGQPWRLHVVPHFGVTDRAAGERRCELIREALRERLQKRRRQLLRALEDTTNPFTERHSLVQLLLTAPDRGFLSIAVAPAPWQQRHLVSPFPRGEITPASDKTAPSRAFAKLLEAELRLGRAIHGGETCVDLGASPGSWSYVALQRGAQVTAVDRAPLRDDLMRHPRLRFERGDAFGFAPATPVDWLLCDVIAAPDRSIDLVTKWVTRGWCRRFVVTIKFKGATDYARLEALKSALPAHCDEFLLKRLCANRNEACAAGVVRQDHRP